MIDRRWRSRRGRNWNWNLKVRETLEVELEGKREIGSGFIETGTGR